MNDEVVAVTEATMAADDDDILPPSPSRLLLRHDRDDRFDFDTPPPTPLESSAVFISGERRQERRQQPEEVASEVIHSLASYCRRRRHRRLRKEDSSSAESSKFDLDDVLTLLDRWDPSDSSTVTTSDDAGRAGADDVGAGASEESFEFLCALSLLGRVLLLAPSDSSSTAASDGAVAPHELVQMAVECQYLTSSEDDEEEEVDDCEGRSIIRTPVISEVSVLCVHLATLGLERALAETRGTLSAPRRDCGGGGEGDGVHGCRGDLPVVPEEEGGGVRTMTSEKERRKAKKKVIRWKRLASTTGSALELARRALTLPLHESCTRFLDHYEDGGGGGGDGVWSDEDDDDHFEDAMATAGARRSEETERTRRRVEADEIRMATRVTNSLLRRLVEAGNSILCLVHEHQEEGRGDDAAKKARVYSVTTHDVAAAGIVTEALDITRTVYFSPPFRDCLVGDAHPPRPTGEDGDVAMTGTARDGGGGCEVGTEAEEGRGALRALSSLILSSPLSLNDVLVQPLRADARERQQTLEESEGYLRETYGDCDLYGEDDPNHISDHRLERFRVDVARRYFDGEVPLQARGVAVFAHTLLCDDGCDDGGEDADGKARGRNMLPFGVLSHSCLWRWFYPHASTLLLSDDVGMALELLTELNVRVPSTASLECWEFDGGRGVDVALDPTGPLGVVGTVQLLINVIMNINDGGGGNSSTDDGDPKMQSSSYILSLIRSLVSRVGDPARQIECVSILVERCPYPSVTPILLDLARPAVSSLGRDDASASGKAGGVVDQDGRDAVREEEVRGAISALVRLVSPFLDQMCEFRGTEEEAVVDGRGGEEGPKGVGDLEAEPATDPIAMLMENHEAYHACATLLGLPCRSALSDDTIRDVLLGSAPFREAVDALRGFRDVLGTTLRTWSSSSSSEGASGGPSDNRAPSPPPGDFFRLYLLEDAVAGTVRAAEEVGVPLASSDGRTAAAAAG